MSRMLFGTHFRFGVDEGFLTDGTVKVVKSKIGWETLVFTCTRCLYEEIHWYHFIVQWNIHNGDISKKQESKYAKTRNAGM